MHCNNCGGKINVKHSFCNNCGKKTNKTDSEKNNLSNSQVSHSIITKEEYEKRKARNKKVGLFWLIAPTIALFIILTMYAMVSFIINSMGIATEASSTISSLINIFLGLLGIIALVGIMIGIPLGIIKLNKREEYPGMIYDTRSGKGIDSKIPKEIEGWNWGAAGLSWIWGASHRVWISFVLFIPLVNLVFWIWLGIKGNELAWRADKWESVDEFLKKQKKWKIWGIIFFILGWFPVIVSVLGK